MSFYVGDDPLEAAGAATLAPRTFYGQILVSSGFCVLQKGVGKSIFDPSVHKLADRRTEIKLDLQMLSEHNSNFPMSRELIAESTEWVKIVLASLRALNVEPRTLNNRWCAMTTAGTGRMYEAKRGANAGQMVEATTFKFLAFYPDEAACRAAFEAENGGGEVIDDLAKLLVASAPVVDQARATAAKFLPALFKAAGGDPMVLEAKIKSMPLMTAHFTIESPEVMALFTAAPPF
jgi:hypothetical protein